LVNFKFKIPAHIQVIFGFF